jgi:hypothetical protein
MDPGAFVQHPVDRCSAQTGRRDNFIYAYPSLNIHIDISTGAHRRDAGSTDRHSRSIGPLHPIKSIMHAFVCSVSTKLTSQNGSCKPPFPE